MLRLMTLCTESVTCSLFWTPSVLELAHQGDQGGPADLVALVDHVASRFSSWFFFNMSVGSLDGADLVPQ